MTATLKSHLLRAALLGEMCFLLLAIVVSFMQISFPSAVTFLSLALVFPALGALAIYAAHIGSKYITSVLQICKFVQVGVLNTLVDLAIYALLSTFFTGGLVVMVLIKSVAFVGAVLNSYVWNKFWVFYDYKRAPKKFVNVAQLGSFISISIGGVLINTLAFAVAWFVLALTMTVSEEFIQISAVLIASLTSLAWNFLGYKFIVFKR